MKPRRKTWQVTAIENGVLILVNGKEEIRLPKSQAPTGAKVGDVLAADFFLAADEVKRQKNLARALLEEILGSQ